MAIIASLEMLKKKLKLVSWSDCPQKNKVQNLVTGF